MLDGALRGYVGRVFTNPLSQHVPHPLVLVVILALIW